MTHTRTTHPPNSQQPIRASSDGHFLMQPDGTPFFFLAENAEYLLWRLTRDETEHYLLDRASKGFTVIMAHLVPRLDMNLPNAYGASVFLEGDVTKPNEAYFEHVDWVIERAALCGLRVGLQPLNGIEYVAQRKFNLGNVEQYGRWLGQRYDKSGLIWVLGHDTTPIWVGHGSFENPVTIGLEDFRPVYDAMASALISVSSHRPFITYHPTGVSLPGTAEPRTSLYLGNRTWLDMNMIQSGHFEDPTAFAEKWGFAFGWRAERGYEPIQNEYASQPTRPIVDGEAHWDDIPRDVTIDRRPERWDETDIRCAAYQSVFSGACGHSYGHASVYAFVVPGQADDAGFIRYARQHWSEAMDAPGVAQLGFLKNLMLSRPYYSRIPDQSIIIGAYHEDSNYICATRDRTGSYLMVYTPKGQPVTIDMHKLSGAAAKAWWFDPRTGKAEPIEGEFVTTGARAFSAPSSGRGNDWVLVLDSAGEDFAVPGTAEPS